MRVAAWVKMNIIDLLFCVILFLPIMSAKNESTLASQHYSRVLKEVRCQNPVPRVVHISQLFPSARKKYVPHCTMLYVCGQESGCCRQENEQCVPKTIEDVDLYFWVVELTPKGPKKGVEVITMKNHTECYCQPLNDNPR